MKVAKDSKRGVTKSIHLQLNGKKSMSTAAMWLLYGSKKNIRRAGAVMVHVTTLTNDNLTFCVIVFFFFFFFFCLFFCFVLFFFLLCLSALLLSKDLRQGWSWFNEIQSIYIYNVAQLGCKLENFSSSKDPRGKAGQLLLGIILFYRVWATPI